DRGGCVIAYADMALNLAKQKGRRSILVHDPATKSQSQDRLDLEADLRQAIVNHELELFYQPIYETRGGALAGWEALARWPRADGGMTSPVEFIPIAEETGSIVQLGAWALTEAAKAACAFRDAGAPEGAFMSVNVSPRQLLDAEGLIEAVDAALKIYPHIKLEVTESGIVDDPARAAEVLGDLRARGASLALDDFGTGASSLAMVGQFPFNTLKIDRSFVIDRSAHASAFLQCIVGLARALDLDTVAEGVDNDDVHAALSLLGASYVQGFGLARPAPRDVILSGFAQNTEPRAANAS
ncbi:MAG: EAL domain-containing protein, partial [Pseudomonadota bacterium]